MESIYGKKMRPSGAGGAQPRTGGLKRSNARHKPKHLPLLCLFYACFTRTTGSL